MRIGGESSSAADPFSNPVSIPCLISGDRHLGSSSETAHRRYAEWTPQRIVNEAAKIGPATIALVEAIMKAKPHPEQGFRSCLGILRLVKTYGIARVEAASQRGNDIGATTYGSIASILKTGLDKAYANPKAPDGPPIRHANIRGRGYYTDEKRMAVNEPAGANEDERRDDAHASHT